MRRLRPPVDAIDFTDLPGTPNAPHRKSAWPRLLLALAALFSVLAVAGWLGYQRFLLPRQDAKAVELALADLMANATVDENGYDPRKPMRMLGTKADEQRLLGYYDEFLGKAPGTNPKLQLAGAWAALQSAIRLGSHEAVLNLGIALRDGTFGPPDAPAALSTFRQVVDATEPGVQTGDADALYLRARMHRDGLGVEADPGKAHTLAVRAAAGMVSSWRAHSVADAAAWGWAPFEHREPEVAARLARALMNRGDLEAYSTGHLTCATSNEGDDRLSCYASWEKLGAESGVREAMGGYASYLLQQQGDVDGALRFFRRAENALTPQERLLFGSLSMLRARDASEEQAGWRHMQTALEGEERLLTPVLSFQHVRFTKEEAFRTAVIFRSLMHQPGTLLLQDIPLNLVNAALASVASQMETSRVVQAATRRLAGRSAFFPESNDLGDIAQRSQPGSRGSERPRQRSEPVKQAKLDPAEQDVTGYLKDAPVAARGGLSTFTVDNRQGGEDAVARLYLGGRKPAVRSFHVKVGESFTADGLAPGDYVLRYRFRGSEDTFEANRVFKLQQVAEESGTRFSNVKVTLFRVAHGNLETKPVAPDEF